MHESRYPSDSVGVYRLEDWAVLQVSGDDARTWLNGQISGSIAEARPGSCVRALVITTQGRVQAELWVHDRGDALDLVVPKSTVEGLLERFDRYIVMDDVDLVRSPARLISLQGPRASELLARDATLSAWPSPRLHPGGFDVVVDADAESEVFTRLAEGAAELGGGVLTETARELFRVRAGISLFGADFGPDTYPREVGLIESAVAFDKGCYVGQEAVVMLQHRGKPPRLLVHLRLEGTAELPSVGTAIVRDGQEVGTLTSVVGDSDEGGGWGLGILKRTAAEARSPVRVGASDATIVWTAPS